MRSKSSETFEKRALGVESTDTLEGRSYIADV